MHAPSCLCHACPEHRTCAVTDLQRRVQAIFFADDNKARRVTVSSLRIKYLRFCFDTDHPLRPRFPPYPVSFEVLCEFCLWAHDHGIGSWASMANYIAEICKHSVATGGEDPRDLSPQHEAAWTHWRTRFKRDLPETHKPPKMAMQPALMEAMALDIRLERHQDVHDMAMYLFLYFTGCRVGCASPTTRGYAAHLLRWGNIIFHHEGEDSVPESAFIWLPSTKTSPGRRVLDSAAVQARRPGGVVPSGHALDVEIDLSAH